MKNIKAEKYIVVLLFAFVLALFSAADKDSKKLKHLYTYSTTGTQKLTSLLVHSSDRK